MERLMGTLPNVPRTLRFLYISAALDCIGWSCITPVLPVLYAKMGLSSSQVSYVAALTGVVSLLSAGVQGSLSDRYSKVTLLKVANVSQMFCTAVLALYALDYVNSWPLFVAIRVLGAFFKMSMVVSQAFVVDFQHATDNKGSLADSGKRATKFISTLMSASNVGFLAGPVLGGFLSQQAVSPFIFSVLVLVANLMTLTQVSDKHPAPIQTKTADPERGMVTEPSSDGSGLGSGSRGVGDMGMSLSERRSIGLRRPKRISIRDYDNDVAREQPYGYQARSDDSNEKDKGRGKRVIDSRLQNTSLMFLLHLKFAFQISNTLYESLFAQHLHERLHTSPYQVGWMLSVVGLEAACVNAFAVPYLMSMETTSTWRWLMLCTCMQTIGTVMWALALSVHSTFLGTLLIGFSSNVFLSLLQGMLGSLAAGSGASSSSSSGMTYGLSTTMDRGARALAPLIGAGALDLKLQVPTALFHLIGTLGPGASPALSKEEAEAITVVHANQTLGLGLVCAVSGIYTLGLLMYHEVTISYELQHGDSVLSPLASVLRWLRRFVSPSKRRTGQGFPEDLAKISSVRMKGTRGTSGYPSSP